MQLASLRVVGQSFRYGPRHLMLVSDPDPGPDQALNGVVYGAPRHPTVRGVLIHQTAAA